MLKRKTKTKIKKYKYHALIVVLVVAGLLVWLLAFYHHKAPVTAVTEDQFTKGVSTTPTPSSSSSSSSTQQPDQAKSPDSTSSSSAPLVAPSGTFVSDHHPNLSGQPNPNQMASTCTTTPGATCQISFTMNGVTKSLATKTTDSGGSAYWSWTLQDIGLTSGTWSIQATASLNGSTQSASDGQNLVISP